MTGFQPSQMRGGAVHPIDACMNHQWVHLDIETTNHPQRKTLTKYPHPPGFQPSQMGGLALGISTFATRLI